jgi:hypothetical protein
MKRRDALRSLVGTAAALSLKGCAYAPAQSGTLTDADVERMAVGLTGITMKRGQAAGVREMLATMRFKGKVDPTVQPAIVFDPEVDIE